MTLVYITQLERGGKNDASPFEDGETEAQSKAVTSEPGSVCGSDAVWVRLGGPERGRTAQARSRA